MNTPTCDEIVAALLDAADGATSPIPPAALAAHLATCPDCRREQLEIDTMRELWTSLEPAVPPPDLAERVMHAVAPAPARDRALPIVALALLAALAVLPLQRIPWAPLADQLLAWLTAAWQAVVPSHPQSLVAGTSDWLSSLYPTLDAAASFQLWLVGGAAVGLGLVALLLHREGRHHA